MLYRPLHLVGAVFGLRWQRPGRFVAGADVDTAEEDGVKFDLDAVLGEERTLFDEVRHCEVGVR